MKLATLPREKEWASHWDSDTVNGDQDIHKGEVKLFKRKIPRTWGNAIAVYGHVRPDAQHAGVALRTDDGSGRIKLTGCGEARTKL